MLIRARSQQSQRALSAQLKEQEGRLEQLRQEKEREWTEGDRGPSREEPSSLPVALKLSTLTLLLQLLLASLAGGGDGRWIRTPTISPSPPLPLGPRG